MLLHTVGITLLRKPNSFKPNQKLYLVNLSINEGLFVIVYNFIVFLEMFTPKAWITYYTWLFIMTGIMVPWCNILIVMIFDRFLEVRLNVKYELYASKKKVKMLIFVCWLTGIIVFISMVFIKHVNRIVVLDKIVFEGYHGLIIFVFVATYVYIYYKIKKEGESIYQKQLSPNSQQEERRTYFIPFFIILTFILFINIPRLIISLNTKTQDEKKIVAIMVSGLLFDCGAMVDALIYIFLNKSIRRKFLHLIKWRKFEHFQANNNDLQLNLETSNPC